MMDFETRELPHWLRKGQRPPQAVADLLRRHASELAAAREEASATSAEAAALISRFGLALYKKRQSPNAADFRVLIDAFESAGGELVTYIGAPFEGDLEELADVIEWLPGSEGIGPGCVADAFERPPESS